MPTNMESKAASRSEDEANNGFGEAIGTNDYAAGSPGESPSEIQSEQLDTMYTETERKEHNSITCNTDTYAGYNAENSEQICEPSTGARNVVRTLEKLGVEVVFGMPGGAILPTYDPLMDSSTIRHILVRHEQGAGHAAEGYAVSTGKVGVCIVTSGPGATNLVTALADANMDSVPMVAITGQVGAGAIGTDAFQEADIVGITMPVTKHSFLVTKPEDVAPRIAEAYYLAHTGRPGPVVVDIAKSAQAATADFIWPPRLDIPGFTGTPRADEDRVRRAARLLVQAKRPVLMVGGGAIRSGAGALVKRIADITGAAVTTTINARGAIADSHPQNLGMPGMHGTVAAVLGIQQCDLLVSLGSRFDDRVTGEVSSFAPKATVIHADIDPAEISKNKYADVALIGDLAQTLTSLIPAVEEAASKYGKQDITNWWKFLDSLRQRYPLQYDGETSDGKLAPQYVLQRLSELADPDAIYVTGVGQHQMWASQFIKYEGPRRWISSGGLGTMGYCVPAAMGAQVGNPDSEVWAIDGDGCFQMTNQELATCVINNIPIKVVLLNNSVLGMVRQWQTLFYDARYSNTNLQPSEKEYVPDFVKLAEAYSMPARRVTSSEDVDEAIQWARSINDRPVLLDFITSKDAMVWPMVPAGTSNDDVLYAREQSPKWELEI